MEVNTFKVIKNDKEYYGRVTGYQYRKGHEDKYYLYMNVNEDNFSIWYDNWFTMKEITKRCDGWKIDKNELLNK